MNQELLQVKASMADVLLENKNLTNNVNALQNALNQILTHFKVEIDGKFDLEDVIKQIECNVNSK